MSITYPSRHSLLDGRALLAPSTRLSAFTQHCGTLARLVVFLLCLSVWLTSQAVTSFSSLGKASLGLAVRRGPILARLACPVLAGGSILSLGLVVLGKRLVYLLLVTLISCVFH